MLEGFKPLDLSFLKNRPLDATKLAGVSDNVPSLQNIAQAITAGTDWSKIAQNTKANEPPAEPTFWQSLMDVLSAGNYAVANGVINGIRANENGQDAIDTIRSAGHGALTGLWAGIGGGLAGLTGIDDKFASDNTNKTRWSDVFNETGILPQPMQDPSTKKFYIQDPNSGELKEVGSGVAQLDQIKNIIGGLGTDIATDPLTYFGAGAIPKVSKGIEAGNKIFDALGEIKGFKKLEATPVADSLNSGAKAQVPLKNLQGIAPDKFPEPIGINDSLKGIVPTASKGIKSTPVASEAAVAPPVAFPEAVAETPMAEKLLARSLSSPANQQKLASKIAGLIQISPDAKTAVKGVSDWLRSKHSGFQFPTVEAYLEKVRNAPPGFFQLIKVGEHPNQEVAMKAATLRKNVVAGIHEAIKTDVALAKREGKAVHTTSAKNIIGDIAAGRQAAMPINELAEGSKPLGRAEQMILGDVIKKYRNNIYTGIFNTANNPEKLAADIAAGKNVKWTGPTQVNIWDTIKKRLVDTGEVKYAMKGRYTKALQMLKSFEDHYMGLGHTPYSAFKATEAVPLRLSDVISHVGLENFISHGDVATTILRSAMSGGEISQTAAKVIKDNPELAARINNAVEEVRASSAVAESPAIEAGMQAGKNSAEQLINENAMSAAKQNDIIDGASKMAKDIASKAGASPAGAKLAQTWVQNAYKASDPVGAVMSSGKMNTLKNMSGVTDKTSFPYKFSNGAKITRALETQLGPISSVAKKFGPAAKVEEWLGARFNAAYRNADLRPIYLANMASAKATVSLRAAEVNQLVKKFSNDGNLWHEAWDVARGVKQAATPEISALSSELQRVMENLFSGSGLRAGAEYETSVAARTQLLRKELNRNFARFGVPYELSNGVLTSNKKGINYFNYSGKKTPPGHTVKRDFSQGIDWLKSWEIWEAKNPLQLIYNIQNAVEHTVRTRVMFDEIIARFGSTADSAVHTTRLNPSTLKEYPYFQGITFSPEAANQAEHFLKALSEVNKPSSKLLQQYDNIMSKWKSSVTIYRPAHYWRNLLGDLTFNWLAGVDSTKPYTIATKVMKSQKGKYEWETLADLTGPNALKKAIQGGATGPVGSNIAFTMKNGKKVTNDMVYIAAYQNGLLPSARVLEDLPDSVPGLLDRVHMPGKLNGAIRDKVHHIHEQRDHFVRLSHFVDSLQKSGKSFEEAVKDASATVRKWHPDGMDLTSFEKNTMRRAFPFYSWTRKAIPLAVESIFSSPGKVMLYPKLQYAGQSIFMTPGHMGDSWSDPYPEDQLWPDWMREKGIGPLLGSPGDYTMINPSNPLQDLAAQFGDAPQMLGNGFSSKGIGGVASMITPALKIPGELMTGTNIQSGAPINDWTQYATGQIPGVSDLSRATNVDLGGTSPKFTDQGFGNQQNLINYLTAAGLTKTNSKTAISGQFDLRDYLKRQRNNG